MTAAHLDYDELADLAEGILDEDTAASAQHHLTDCDDCRRRADEVAAVSRLLADAPMPTMPGDLMDRLDAAIAAEAASYAPAHHGRRFQLIAAAAAAVVVIGGGAVIAGNVMGSGGSSSADGPKAADPKKHTALAPNPGDAQDSYPMLDTGTRYTAGNLSTKVSAAITKNRTGQHAMMAPSGSLAGCVKAAAPNRTPLLVDTGTYDGHPATVIVVPTTTNTLDIIVVPTNCTPTAHPLTTRTIPR